MILRFGTGQNLCQKLVLSLKEMGMRYPFLRMTKVRRIRELPHTEPNPKTRRDIKWYLIPPQLEEIDD
jgi:hypothetical protein